MDNQAIQHLQTITRRHFLGGAGLDPEYRPTVHYAYHPCNDAVLSLHEMFGQAGKRQPKVHILDENEIESLRSISEHHRRLA